MQENSRRNCLKVTVISRLDSFGSRRAGKACVIILFKCAVACLVFVLSLLVSIVSSSSLSPSVLLFPCLAPLVQVVLPHSFPSSSSVFGWRVGGTVEWAAARVNRDEPCSNNQLRSRGNRGRRVWSVTTRHSQRSRYLVLNPLSRSSTLVYVLLLFCPTLVSTTV